MEVEYLILADAVQAVGGKLYMLGGGWTTFRARQIPITHPLGIALGLRVPWEETNQLHRLQISLVNSDGESLVPPMQAELEMGRPPGLRPGSDQTAVIAVNAPVTFAKAGRYEVRAAVEGQTVRTVVFDVVAAQPSPASR